MKKIIIIAALLLASISASAQHVGIVGGFTSSELKLKNIEKSSVSQYHVGLAFHQPLILGFAIQPELIYNVKGTSFDKISSLSDFKATLGYVELPIQLQWGVDLLVARPYVFAEPFVGYAVNGKVKGNILGGTALESKVNEKIDMSDMDSRWEYGFSLGCGVDILKRVQVSVKYFWNFENCKISDYTEQVKDSISDKKGFTGVAVSAAIFF